MSVKLVSTTKPLVEGINTAEEFIVYCGRVSNPTNQLNTETSPRLIKYLIEHKHWSPFEMASMTVEIVTSRAIAAQILRHRSFSFQEFSQRYAAAASFQDIEWRLQGKTNRQVGDDVVDLSSELKDEVDTALLTCKELYDKLVSRGLAKECARMILPLTTTTTMYMTGTLRSWLHYLAVRDTKETQKEHRLVAQQIKQIVKKEFPIIAEALEWNT